MKKEERILLVSHSAKPSGAELSLVDIATWLGGDAVVCLFQDGPVATALRERGVRVEILAAPQRMLGVRAEARVWSVVRAIPDVVALAAALRRFTVRGDVLYANSQKAWVICALVAWWSRVPVIWHLRDILSSPRFGRLQRSVAVLLANRVASRVLVNSAATGEAFVALGGRKELVRVVHNGIDATPFGTPGDTPVSSLRRELGLPEGFTVGVFGRLAPWKGQHVLLEALEEVPGVNAVVVGDALFGETDYLEELGRLARTPALAGRVRFLGHRADVPSLMKAVDVVIHTSIEPEPFGRVIVEGMLAARPVIATAGGGVREIVSHGVDGIVVQPNDPAALAAAIKTLAADPAGARRLAAAGYETATGRFLLRDMCPRIAQALQSLVLATQ